MPRLLVCEEVSKAFGALRAVDGVSFAVEQGEVFGIAGPNGSGKSTLFNAITGVPYAPDSGRILFVGNYIERVPAHRICQIGIARTFQNAAVFPTLSIRQNVEVGMAYGRSGKPSMGDVRSLLNFVGLAAEQADRPAGDISIFDKKRLMIASALATAPRLLLLDEPASGLIKPEVEALIDLIRKVRDRGVTVVVIEHVLSLLLSVSERLMVLNQGEVLAIGEAEAVVADPAVIEAYLGSGARRERAAA